jgi:hypothetical protein
VDKILNTASVLMHDAVEGEKGEQREWMAMAFD